MSHFDIDLSRPAPRQRPLEVAPGTFAIRALTASVGGTWTHLNSMVIRAAEPVIVDTGMITHRDEWFEDVFSIVAPEAVRWIFVSHIDTDHAGNLAEALERCPNAAMITSRGESFRVAASLGIPFERMRMVENGQRFAVGDRTLRAARPPVYDSPYTRGLFDEATGVYYASDAFCAPVPEGPVDWVEEIAPELWADGLARFHHASLCPWVALADQAKYQEEIDRLACLGIDVIVSAHSPAIRGASVPRAFELLARLPSTVPPAPAFAELAG
jgi:flavorubredoxin